MRSPLLSALSCLLMLLLVVVLAGCSPAAPVSVPTLPAAPPTQAPDKVATSEPAQAATPEVVQPVADDWARIRKAGVLRVASSLDNPPFDMYDDKFEADGFDIALITELAQRLGLKVEIRDWAFDGLLTALQSGQADAAISAMAVTDDRTEQVDFTLAYYQGEDAVLAAPNSAITAVASKADITSRKVGVQRGTVYETWIKTNLIETNEMPARNLMVYADPEVLINALNAGAVDLVVMDGVPGLNYEKQGKAKVVGKSLYVQDFAIAVPKGSGLQPELNAALRKVAGDGTLARLVEQYLQIPAGNVTPVPVEEATATPAAPATPAPTPTLAPYDAVGWKDTEIDQTIPDHTKMKPGQSFAKVWRIINTGTTTWSPDYYMAYSYGQPDVPATQMQGQPTKMGVAVPPGQSHDVSVALVAPSAGGEYKAFWQMHNASGTGFGGKVYLDIIVVTPTPVTPPTATPVPGISFSWQANPNPVQAGGTTTISWNVTGVVKGVWFCLQPNQECEGVGQVDSRQRQPPYSPVTNYELRVLKTDGQTTVYAMPVSVTQPVNAPNIRSFDANPKTVRAGDPTTLWWDVSGATQIQLFANGNLIAQNLSSNTQYQDRPGWQTTYELRALGAGNPASKTVAVNVEQTCQPQSVTLYDQQCGTPVNFCRDSTLTVVLTAAGGSGYTWQQSADLNASILQPQGVPNVQPGGSPGAPDMYTWQYRAVGTGQTNLTFDLKRGGEAPIQSCSFPVTVQ